MRICISTNSYGRLLLAFIVTGFFSASVDALSFRRMDVRCPVGGETFSITAITSATYFDKRLDLMPLGPAPAPWPLDKCPGNGFVIYKPRFTEDELTRLTKYAESEEYQVLARENTNYFLAAKLMEASGDSTTEIAYALLQATWEARSSDQYRTYARSALAAFDRLLEDQELQADKRAEASLVAVELERRLGLFDKAKERLLAVSRPAALRAPMNRMHAAQLQLVRERNSKPALIPPESKQSK
jgi:hypothetical protein